jgi:FlaA1/EpsC-like NDP-sugar epimerase
MRSHKSILDTVLMGADALLAFASVGVSFALRFDPLPAVENYLQRILITASMAALLKPAVLRSMDLYSIYWRYAGAPEVRRMLGASVTASIALAAAVALIQSPFPDLRGIPASVLLVDFLVMTLGLDIVRLLINSGMAEAGCGRS